MHRLLIALALLASASLAQGLGQPQSIQMAAGPDVDLNGPIASDDAGSVSTTDADGDGMAESVTIDEAGDGGGVEIPDEADGATATWDEGSGCYVGDEEIVVNFGGLMVHFRLEYRYISTFHEDGVTRYTWEIRLVCLTPPFGNDVVGGTVNLL